MEQSAQKLQQYAQLFQLTFSAQTDEDRKKAENDIMQASREDQLFLQHILHLLVENEQMNNVSANIRKAASIYINTYIRFMLTVSEIKDEYIQQTIELLFQALIEPNIQYQYKSPIITALTVILQIDQSNNFKTIIFTKVLEILKEKNVNKYLGCFLTVQPLLTATKHIKHLEKITQNICDQLCDAVLEVLQPIKQKLQELGSQNVNLDEQMKKEIKDYIQIIFVWTQTIKAFIWKFTENEQDSLKSIMAQFLHNTKIAFVFSNILELTYPNSNQIQDCLISTTNIETIDSSLNELKGILIRSYMKINTFIFDNRIKVDIKNNIYFQMLSQLLPKMMNSVYTFCLQAQQNLFTILEDAKISQIIVECLIFLKTCGGQHEFYPIFSQNKKQLVLNVILPLMVASPEEIQNFDDHPEEFIHLALDTCDKQLSENYKTAASQLLEIICDNIDGAISLVGDICIRNLKASILKISNPNISDDQILPLIQDQIQSIFVKQNSSESRIETSFLALSVMSYTIPKRVDIVTEIENFFRQNLPVLLNFNTMSGLVISRICMFIGYYSDTIFQSKQESDEQIYLQLIDYLFKCTQLTGKQGIALQAIDALINIYDEEELSARLKTTIKPMFSLLINSIETTTVTQYLDLVQTMILTFQVELQENLPLVLQCLQCLVERIKKEFQLVQSGERTTQLYINKCWNIIRVIADTEGYIVKICNEMEELLLPLLSAIQQPEKIEFDDDILLTITSFLKFKQTITPLTAQLLQYFPQVLKKQNNLFAHMFQTLSYVINYGKQYFEQNTNETIAILQMIIQMSVESMCAVGKRITEADQGEGAILLQMIILEFSHILSDEMWNVIFTKVTERLNQPVENYFLKGRLLGIYLQGFFKQPEKTRVMLQDVLGIINNVFDLILEKCENYSTNFDIKVFVLGTCSILLQQSFTEHIQQKFPTILDFNITLLKKQEVMEVKKRKGHSMEENSDDDGEYDSDDDEDYKFGEDSIIQDKITLDYLVCNIKKADEFDHFKQCMFALKDRNQEQLYQILNLLNQEKGSFLKHLLNMQRINVGEKQVVRKIVKRKKNE